MSDKTGSVKIWLDDLRPMPADYNLHVTTTAEAKAALMRGGVTHISFDHDLGPEEAGNGYHVAVWIEEAAFNSQIPRILWRIHSANPVGRASIERAMANADRYWAKTLRDE